MNLLGDGKGASFYRLTRGERVRLMMQHSYEMQRSPLRDLKKKTDEEGKEAPPS